MFEDLESWKFEKTFNFIELRFISTTKFRAVSDTYQTKVFFPCSYHICFSRPETWWLWDLKRANNIKTSVRSQRVKIKWASNSFPHDCTQTLQRLVWNTGKMRTSLNQCGALWQCLAARNDFSIARSKHTWFTAVGYSWRPSHSTTIAHQLDTEHMQCLRTT